MTIRFALFVVASAVVADGCSAGSSSQRSYPPMPPQWQQSLERMAAGVRLRRGSGSTYIYASIELSQSTGAINWYPVGANGDVPPVGSISGSQTRLGHVNGIAISPAGELYVANSDTSSIVGFQPGATGNVAPNIVIAGPKTHLDIPVGIASDGQGNVYATNQGANGSIVEFSAGSNGNVKPFRQLSGIRTLLRQPNQLVVDSTGNVFVAERADSAILEFGPKQHGDASPHRVIIGRKTGIDTPNGIAVSPNGIYLGSGVQPYFERFDLGVHGDKPPAALVEGSYTQLQCCTNGLALEPTSGTIYVVWAGGGGGVSQFAPLANGNVAPVATISGPNSKIGGVVFIAVN